MGNLAGSEFRENKVAVRNMQVTVKVGANRTNISNKAVLCYGFMIILLLKHTLYITSM